MSSITTGIIGINLFGEIEFVNKEALRVLKKEKEEVVGNHYLIIFWERWITTGNNSKSRIWTREIIWDRVWI